MRSINKLVKTAHIEGKSWTHELFKFLRNYRGTPHPTTTSFCFKEDKFVHDCLKDVRKKDADQKRKMKYRAK